MIDIREVCKVFLSFIYKEQVLPTEIIKTIDENHMKNDRKYSIKWDIRAILNIIKYRDAFVANQKMSTAKVQTEIANKRSLLSVSNCNPKVYNWMVDNNRGISNSLDFCNDFFHDVNTDPGTEAFCATLKELIKKFKAENMETYIQQIETIMNKGNQTKTIEHKEIKRDKSSLDDLIVAYCFSNYEHDSVYPTLSQQDAFIKAAEKLGGIKVNTLKQARDCFDGNYKDIPYDKPEKRKKIGRRVGYKAPLSPVYQKIKDEYDQKSKDEVVAKVREILA